MKEKISAKKNKTKRKKRTAAFVLFFAVPVMILIFRTFYDVKTYYFGGSLIVRNSSEFLYDYCLHIPPGYTPFTGPRPLIISLHGSGESGADVSEIKNIDYVVMTVKERQIDKSDFPFIVASPVAPKQGWEPWRVKALTEKLSGSGIG